MSEGSGSDMVDSDFSIDEADEVKSDPDDDDHPKRKKGVNTKAYKVCELTLYCCGELQKCRFCAYILENEIQRSSTNITE